MWAKGLRGMRKFPKRNIHICADEAARLFSLARSGELLRGDQVNKFERSLAEFTGAKYAIAAGSGRFALSLILRAVGLVEGDEILLSAYNYPGLVASLLKEKYRVSLVDAGADGFQMDVSEMEKKIGPRTRAVVATHLLGQPCDIEGISMIAKRHGLKIVEDAAHSLGTTLGGRHTGTFGECGFLSFSGSKPVNTSCGGMILTGSLELYQKIISELDDCPYPEPGALIQMRLFTYLYAFFTSGVFYGIAGYPAALVSGILGWDPWEIYNRLPREEFADKKLRFSNMQACIGMAYMNDLPRMLARRRAYAERLYRGLKNNIVVAGYKEGANHFMIPLRAKDKKSLYKKLLLKGIDANLGYAYDCSYLTKTFNPRACALEKSLLMINLPFVMDAKEADYLSARINACSDELLSAG